MIEKPFGHDLASAKELNAHILSELDESQIFRIDHFLGKETVQNIMALRFCNGIFEPLWNRDHIDSVQITAAETVGVEKRGKFYESTGALRDMVPNHMFQLLAMIAMEPPNSFDADAVRSEKAKVIEAIQPMTAAVSAQTWCAASTSPGTCRRADVAATATSRTSPATADRDLRRDAAEDRQLALGRGAVLPAHRQAHGDAQTEIAIHFKQAPFAMFRDTPVEKLTPNVMVLHMQPHEGITLHFSAKQPGRSRAEAGCGWISATRTTSN